MTRSNPGVAPRAVDVSVDDAARLYESLGWRRVGDIPRYALMPRGGLCSTTVYYRDVDP